MWYSPKLPACFGQYLGKYQATSHVKSSTLQPFTKRFYPRITFYIRLNILVNSSSSYILVEINSNKILLICLPTLHSLSLQSPCCTGSRSWLSGCTVPYRGTGLHKQLTHNHTGCPHSPQSHLIQLAPVTNIPAIQTHTKMNNEVWNGVHRWHNAGQTRRPSPPITGGSLHHGCLVLYPETTQWHSLTLTRLASTQLLTWLSQQSTHTNILNAINQTNGW